MAGAIAGPWYLRNFWLTGNPVFPLEFRSVAGTHFLRGLFTTAVSDGLVKRAGLGDVLTANYAMPVSLLVLLGVAWIVIGIGARGGSGSK